MIFTVNVVACLYFCNAILLHLQQFLIYINYELFIFRKGG